MPTDPYGQGIAITALTDAPDAGVLAAALGGLTGLTPRTVMQFASASARSAALTGPTAPVGGMTTWLIAEKRLDVYDGSAWNTVPLKSKAYATLTTSTGTTSAEILTGLSITMTTRAGTAYVLQASGLLRSTLVNDRVDLLIRRGTTTAGTQVGGGVLFTKIASTGESASAYGVDTPGAGTTTWVVTISGVGSGLVDLTASSAFPAVFTVDEQ